MCEKRRMGQRCLRVCSREAFQPAFGCWGFSVCGPEHMHTHSRARRRATSVHTAVLIAADGVSGPQRFILIGLVLTRLEKQQSVPPPLVHFLLSLKCQEATKETRPTELISDRSYSTDAKLLHGNRVRTRQRLRRLLLFLAEGNLFDESAL